MTRILYFARFRQVIGRSQDEIELPPGVTTVQGLLDYLICRDEGCAQAFADRKIIKAAINKTYVSLDAPLAGGAEIAFFPPVTGG